MIGVLVICHEPLATALISCTRHVFGRMLPQLAALDVIPDEDPTLACDAARHLLERINDGGGVIVLTDIYGATPSRIAASLIEPFRVEVVAGVNLPVLLKALNTRRGPLEDLVDTLIERGRDGLLRVERPLHVMPDCAEDPPVGGPRPLRAPTSRPRDGQGQGSVDPTSRD